MERKMHTAVLFKLLVIFAAFAALFAPVRYWILDSVGF
ncbi:hypothetical protein GGR40_003405 [Novosphingobium gossypii]